jgi:hypothetical protein
MRGWGCCQITRTAERLCVSVLCFVLSSFAAVNANKTTAPGPKQAPLSIKVHPKPASVPHLYWHFLMYQNHLDRAAAAHVKKGKDGTWLSGHFQKELGFTDEQIAAVRGSAQRLDTELKGLGGQMRTVLQTDRALYKQHLIAAETPPPGRPQLLALKNQREAFINDEVTRLNQSLGSEAAARLKNFLETDFARSVNVYEVRSQPRPNLHPTHRLHSEGQ